MISLSSEKRDAVESLLSRLSGVHSVRIDATESGDVERIHVVSTGQFSPAQQARNIESALLAALNLEVHPALISVVPLEDGYTIEEGSLGMAPRERRARLSQIFYQQDGFKVTAHVELEWQGQAIRGSSQDTDTPKGRMVAAARATLNAVESMADRRAAFFLEGLETHQTFERAIVVASLRVVSQVRKADLVGCANLEEDPNYAAAQAVLGATNRALARLLVDRRPEADGRHFKRLPANPSVYPRLTERPGTGTLS